MSPAGSVYLVCTNNKRTAIVTLSIPADTPPPHPSSPGQYPPPLKLVLRNVQCWFYAGPASQTLVQQKISIGSMCFPGVPVDHRLPWTSHSKQSCVKYLDAGQGRVTDTSLRPDPGGRTWGLGWRVRYPACLAVRAGVGSPCAGVRARGVAGWRA